MISGMTRAKPQNPAHSQPRLRKVLYFDRTGLCVWSKRLEQGRLIGNWDSVTTQEMDYTGLKLLLEGIEPKRVRKRYQKTAFS